MTCQTNDSRFDFFSVVHFNVSIVYSLSNDVRPQAINLNFGFTPSLQPGSSKEDPILLGEDDVEDVEEELEHELVQDMMRMGIMELRHDNTFETVTTNSEVDDE